MGDLPSFSVIDTPDGALAAPTYIDARKLAAGEAVTMSAAERALPELRTYDCKLHAISDLTDGRVLATIIRRDNTSVGVALSVADLEYWAARIAAILAKANAR